MPVINVQYPQGSLSREQKQLLAHSLTEVLLEMEGGAKTLGGLGFASVLFSAVPNDDWWVGGCTDATYVAPPGKFLVHVAIPEGYMNQAHKSGVHAAINSAILNAMRGEGAPGTGISALVIIDEVTEGNWGSGGKTISLGAIAEKVGLPRNGERFRWVQNYFAAKARQFLAAGYPKDVGGLLCEDLWRERK
jgi:phenylpyruvate tautomerase PptA (4-oxalocrotonate tautomerase family)